MIDLTKPVRLRNDRSKTILCVLRYPDGAICFGDAIDTRGKGFISADRVACLVRSHDIPQITYLTIYSVDWLENFSAPELVEAEGKNDD